MGERGMEIRVEHDLCTGCGVCETICPEVFEMDGGASAAKDEMVPPEAEGFCLEAVWMCPNSALYVRNLIGGLVPQWSTLKRHDAACPAVN